MSNRMKWFSGAGVAACLAAGGVVAGAGAGTSDPVRTAEPEALAADAAPVQSIEPEQAGEIGELRRSRTTDDALPPRWGATLTDDGSDESHWGANPALSRRTGPGVWIVPGDGYVCVANTAPDDGGMGLGCATPDDVDRGLLAPSDVDANGNGVVTGVVPDGVDRVTLVDRDGSTRSADVDRNTYRAAIDANLKEVRFTGADGGVRVLPMAWDR
jgi:hypothetical protein